MPTKERIARQETYLAKITKAARTQNLQRFSQNSMKWFMKETKKLSGTRARQTILDDAINANLTVSSINSGDIVCYLYDAKHKKTLPYYDQFPLGIAVEPAKGGMYVLSLHYLPNMQRAIFMQKLLDITNNKRYDKTTKFLLSYQMLKSASNLKMFKSCFKYHLYSQIRSPIIKIPPQHWEAILFLPMAKFNAPNSKVWSDSILKGSE